jgi:hypothetical protein
MNQSSVMVGDISNIMNETQKQPMFELGKAAASPGEDSGIDCGWWQQCHNEKA